MRPRGRRFGARHRGNLRHEPSGPHAGRCTRRAIPRGRQRLQGVRYLGPLFVLATTTRGHKTAPGWSSRSPEAALLPRIHYIGRSDPGVTRLCLPIAGSLGSLSLRSNGVASSMLPAQTLGTSLQL